MSGLHWKEWNSNEFDGYLSMILYPMELIMLILLFFLFIYLFKNQRKPRTHYIILISLILSMIYIILAYTFIDGNILMFDLSIKYQNLYGNLITGIIVIQRTSVYAFHVYKLSVSFQGSVYEVKNYTVIIIYGILIIICISYFILTYIFSCHSFVFKCQNNDNIDLIFVSFGVMDILFGYISIKVFAGKIYKVLKLRMVPEMNFVAHKLIVLSVIASISCIIFIIISGLILNEYITSYKLFGIDLIINNIVLILSFGKGNTIYKNICCCCSRNFYKTSFAVFKSASVMNINNVAQPHNHPKQLPSNTAFTIQSSKPALQTTKLDGEQQSFKLDQLNETQTNEQTKTNDLTVKIDSKLSTHKNLKKSRKSVTFKLPHNNNNNSNSRKSRYKKSTLSPIIGNNNLDSLTLEPKNNSNSSSKPKLSFKNYSGSSKKPKLSDRDSLSTSQHIIPSPTTIKLPSKISENTTKISKRKDSIVRFVSKITKLPEDVSQNITNINNNIDTNIPSPNTVTTYNGPNLNIVITPFEPTTNNNDIDWDDVELNIDTNYENENNIHNDINDDYESIKHQTPSTCVIHLKELGIIL